jgi:putative transposase
MKQKRFTEAQIVDILGLATKGDMTVRDICALHGVHEVTFYRWRRKYGEMSTTEVKRLRELEGENARLKRMLAERDLEIDVIRDVLRGK